MVSCIILYLLCFDCFIFDGRPLTVDSTPMTNPFLLEIYTLKIGHNEKVHFRNIKSGNMETCNVSLFLMYIFCNASFWHRFYTSFSSYCINFLWILVQRTVVCLWCIDVTRIDMKYLVLHFEGLRTTKFERFETLNNEVYSSTCSYIIIHGGL